jgi:hypothetical protein
MPRRKTTTLIHETYGPVKILAARYTSTGGKEMFLVEANPGTKQATQHQLLIGNDGQWWNEDPEVVTDTFETFMRDSDNVEKALALKARKASEAEAATAAVQTYIAPDSEPERGAKPPEIRRREREDLTDFDLEFDSETGFTGDTADDTELDLRDSCLLP